MDFNKEKIGILGGTFDPIHLGHIHIARAALKEYGLSKIWFMPAAEPYFKKKLDVTNPLVRLEMVRVCLRGLNNPNFECSDFEFVHSGLFCLRDVYSEKESYHLAFQTGENNRPTYTAETLEKLKSLYPDTLFYFIVGLDSLIALGSWYKPEFIFQNAIILYALRNIDLDLDEGANINDIIAKYEKDYSSSSPDIKLIHTNQLDISSTKLRQMVKNGEDISAFVTKDVYKFITDKGIYE